MTLDIAGIDTPSGEAVAIAARRGFDLGQRLNWRSYDPYDLLLSPYLIRIQSVSHFGSRVVIQVGKHFGERLRRAFAVPHHEEPKALADFLRAAVMLAEDGEDWAHEYAPLLSSRLQAHA